ncbi:shikimate kinase [Gangjinia marincola]|uniref:Shikimate kinase n=1 Tax=Gangjinia marincola TaxID=578463 RepID=A0ABN1MGH1_9FLAO
MKVVLMGYMGSGKSVIGRKLANTIAYKYADLDEYIEKGEGQNIVEIFTNHSEIYFRKIENAYLKKLLDTDGNFVISLGGGTPCYSNNINLIKDASNTSLIYLETSIDTLTNRLFSEINRRPLISHLTNKIALNDFIRKHLFERSYYYNQADYKISTDHKSIKMLAEEIRKVLF